MTLSEFNASLPKKEEREAEKQKQYTPLEYIKHLEEQLEICKKENIELRHTVKCIKGILDYIIGE